MKSTNVLLVHACSRRGQRGHALCGGHRLWRTLLDGDYTVKEATVQHLCCIKHCGFQQHFPNRQCPGFAQHQLGFARRHRETQAGNGCTKPGSGTGNTDVAAAGDFNARAHAVAFNLRHDGHVAVQHGLQTAPDVVFMKRAQALFLKPKTRVFRDVTPCAEVATLPLDKDAAQADAALQALKPRTQLAPHRTRHGVELTRVRQRD